MKFELEHEPRVGEFTDLFKLKYGTKEFHFEENRTAYPIVKHCIDLVNNCLADVQ